MRGVLLTVLFSLALLPAGAQSAPAEGALRVRPVARAEEVARLQQRGLRAPLVAILGAQQGLLFYCFTHFLRLT